MPTLLDHQFVIAEFFVGLYLYVFLLLMVSKTLFDSLRLIHIMYYLSSTMLPFTLSNDAPHVCLLE
jgi:hypothetical protein